MKRSKHRLLVFPPKKTQICKRHCSISQSCCSITVKAKYRLISRKFFGHEVLYPSVRLTNQKPRTFVSVRQTNQIDLFPFVCCFCLFARFHFKVIRKSLYSHIFVFLLPSLQSFKMISDKIEWARWFSLGYRVVSPEGQFARWQFAQTTSIRLICICRSLSPRKKNKHGKTVTAHVESKVN